MRTLKTLGAAAGGLALTSVSHAQEAVFNAKLEDATDGATLFFGVIVTLCVLVTGFFVGRRWFKSV